MLQTLKVRLPLLVKKADFRNSDTAPLRVIQLRHHVRVNHFRKVCVVVKESAGTAEDAASHGEK